MRKDSGFTLIEVMVTVAIVAILAAIAIPNYSQYVQKTRRTDAQEKLLDMAAQQERWFFTKNQYT
ncbi:MAG: prepilin-type N-terminal cleavage/methylation domain-containing protein, partial [Moraxellaceae bacterium]